MKSMSARHFYEPRLGHGLRHDPFNAIVGPRPIGWISTRSADGVPNLAPYSFFNAFNYAPPIVGFSSIGWKDSVENIQQTGMFGWNLANMALAEAMNASSAAVAPEVDEFALAGLEADTARLITAPLVRLAPVSFECRLSQLIRLQGADGAAVDSWLVLGEVVGVHIDRAFLQEGSYVTALAEPILRGGGPADYFAVRADAQFAMKRPKI
jgi:flavin reductase (DIM6/NTAB) family NADH-FMN oxidoreductase RutF